MFLKIIRKPKNLFKKRKIRVHNEKFVKSTIVKIKNRKNSLKNLETCSPSQKKE